MGPGAALFDFWHLNAPIVLFSSRECGTSRLGDSIPWELLVAIREPISLGLVDMIPHNPPRRVKFDLRPMACLGDLQLLLLLIFFS